MDKNMKSDRKNLNELKQIEKYVVEGNLLNLPYALDYLDKFTKFKSISRLCYLAITHNQAATLNYLLSIKTDSYHIPYFSLFKDAASKENFAILNILSRYINRADFNELLKFFVRQNKLSIVEWMLTLKNVPWYLSKQRALFLAFSSACKSGRGLMANTILNAIMKLPIPEKSQTQHQLIPSQHQAALEFLAQKNFSNLYDVFPLFNEANIHVAAIEIALKSKLMDEVKKLLTPYLNAPTESLEPFISACAVDENISVLKHLFMETALKTNSDLASRAFLYAILRNQTKPIKFLLNHQPALLLDCLPNTKHIFEALLDRIEVNYQELSRLRHAPSKHLTTKRRCIEKNKNTASLLLAYGAGIGLKSIYINIIYTRKINVKNCIMLGAEITRNNIAYFSDPKNAPILNINAFKEMVLKGLVFPRKTISMIINTYLDNAQQNAETENEHADKKPKKVLVWPEQTLMQFKEAATFLSTPLPLLTQTLAYLSLHPRFIPPQSIPEELEVALQNAPKMSTQLR